MTGVDYRTFIEDRMEEGSELSIVRADGELFGCLMVSDLGVMGTGRGSTIPEVLGEIEANLTKDNGD